MTKPLERVLICSWLEEDLVERIRQQDPRLRVEYHPDLLPEPRYSADHTGKSLVRTESDEQRWVQLLSEATILFDFDRTHLQDLHELAPKVRWVQATSAGIGQLMRRQGFAERMPDTVFTTASGIHTRPLAEFVAMCLMMHSRRALDMFRAQQARHWERFAGTDLEGRTVLIVGLGAIGRAVSRVANSLGMEVVGIRRTPAVSSGPNEDRTYGPEKLGELLPRAEFLVLIAPHTAQTEGIISARELTLLPQGAALINIGRGVLVDETALIEALRSGHLGGAYLDVFEEEPLPPESPLWGMSNVLVSPHSGSTSDRENIRLTELFCDNLSRRLQGQRLRNIYDHKRGY